jgi:hypothetical protein
MFNKLFLIITLIALVVFFVPKDVFCNDHHEIPLTHHHCSITCHSCSTVIVPDRVSFQEAIPVSHLQIFEDVSYQNPTISRLKRPPIYLS